ncbi:MAG: N-acetylmuramoyl-L-alanine amidase [Gammaproteobacteria bacterium]
MLRLSLLLLLALSYVTAFAGPARVQGVRIADRDGVTRVAIDLSAPIEHKLFTLSNPERVVVDIRPARFASVALPLPAGTGRVQRLRGANRQDGSLRIVLDMHQATAARSFVLPAGAQTGDRLVIDLGQPRAASAAKKPPVVKTVPAAPGRGRELIIAVDAGHGGKDPGAHGRRGTQEKDVTLAISKRLARAIDAEPGMRAVLTRDRDTFVPLRARMERARSARADLFLSIHADAFRDRRVRGATVYALSNKGATDEASRRLAERENAAVLIGGVHLEDKDPTLAGVLMDLSQNATLSTSIDVGEQILDEFGEFAHVRKRQVQQAPFLVLKSPDVPSLLIETAFISNPDDESRLRRSDYQARLANAILDGVRDYFYQNPPPGSRVAQLAQNRRPVDREHVIRRGDTLSGIADRYNVSVRNIRTANQLRGDRIRIGQRLRIPLRRGT